jgi:alpha-L-fucosidase
MKVNGEAIYGSSIWKVFHEPARSGDPTANSPDARAAATVNVRFTAKGNSVYAICLAWPKRELSAKALGKRGTDGKTVAAVRLLGSSEAVRWHQTEDSLILSVPREKPCRYAFVYRVDFKAK